MRSRKDLEKGYVTCTFEQRCFALLIVSVAQVCVSVRVCVCVCVRAEEGKFKT